jgi:hypothetical protein
MFPIYIHEYKITIWWSAKCGCSTIKDLVFNKLQKLNKNDLHKNTYAKFDPQYLNYKNILIVRDPINRFISSYNMFFKIFCNMYKINKNLTFSEFVELIFESRKKDNFTHHSKINVSFNHHLINQFSESYTDLNKYCKENNINFHFDEVIKLEDFNSIDFMKKYFDIILKKDIIKNKTLKNNNNTTFVYDKTYNEIIKIKNDYQYYLNENIIKKIKEIYKNDYEELKKYNIIY